MSCYLVGNDHINALVQWAHQAKALPAGLTRQDVAQLLYSANVRSFNARYRESEPEAFTYCEPLGKVPTDHEALHLIERLDYQCDNWPEWERSLAQKTLKKWASRTVNKGGAL